MRLLDVTLQSAGKFLVVESPEPGCLAVVRPLAGSLEKQPLLRVVPFRRVAGKADLVVRIVLFDEVQQDGTGLSQRDVCVGVLDGRQRAVRINGHVLGLLDVAEGGCYDLMGDAEFI